MKTWNKDPSAVKDYYWDWTKWMTPGDSLSTIAFDTTNTLVVDSYEVIGSKVKAMVSGGDPNSEGIISCSIVTSQGRVDTKSALFIIKPE
jgi:hypothetical protein